MSDTGGGDAIPTGDGTGDTAAPGIDAESTDPQADDYGEAVDARAPADPLTGIPIDVADPVASQIDASDGVRKLLSEIPAPLPPIVATVTMADGRVVDPGTTLTQIGPDGRRYAV